MLFYVYLISLIATITVIQAQTLPSATTCAKGSPISIKRNDCKQAFGQFAIESGVIFWSPHANSHSCGTCKVMFQNPGTYSFTLQLTTSLNVLQTDNYYQTQRAPLHPSRRSQSRCANCLPTRHRRVRGFTETVPSAITCAPGQGSPILKDDCKKAFAKFFKESGIVYWSRGADSESCGTCKITLTKPSMRTNSVHRAGLDGDALTALNSGMDKCTGAPANVTIGITQPISVLLDNGVGDQQFATLTGIQAQTLPTATTCAQPQGQGNSIAKDDCTKALSKFYVESGVVFWSRKVDSHACGTCKVTFTKPSVPNSVHLAGPGTRSLKTTSPVNRINGDAVTALRQGIETCGGAPVNVTIGDSNQPISVLLDYGAGEKC
ncbi:hypothetical protein PSHT_01613 [Puccinia striiformis]|uniref:Uncharacterized protein n=1 Tax=Puccinia striiformis TaxID=27350 RepID=A0A2S4WK48_9BASI|nr:hypothetical protein PSHT_01613 [Puccinia striiformis]